MRPRAEKAKKREEKKAVTRLSPIESARAKQKKLINSVEFKALSALSEYVRTIGTHIGPDGGRWGACVTCPPGTPYKRYEELQAGHWIRRKFNGTRFDPRNVHPQCRYCNDPHRGGGRYDEHEAWIRKNLGDGVIYALLVAAKTNKRVKSEAELEEITRQLKGKTATFLAEEAKN